MPKFPGCPDPIVRGDRTYITVDVVRVAGLEPKTANGFDALATTYFQSTYDDFDPLDLEFEHHEVA